VIPVIYIKVLLVTSHQLLSINELTDVREVHRGTSCASQYSFVEAEIVIENLKRFKSMLVKSQQS
jgi:hypothetical protein